MSEVIRKMDDLRKRVFDLEEELRATRSRYADEIDHADHLAVVLAQVNHDEGNALYDIAVSALKYHDERRQGDDEFMANRLSL